MNGLLVPVGLGLGLVLPSTGPSHGGPGEPPRVRSSTAAAPLSAEDEELARYLYLLENWELLRDLSMTEVLEVLEEIEP